ncbi:MAG: 50S ribosomal protein L4 [Candidatus Doudnabacteria bacterium]|nr:50S ribosomal protein L4 [Candidatus Doudnabacteria bacterium]
MKISVYNQLAETVGEVELNDKIYAVKPTKHLLAEAVRTQLSNARKGLAHTKTRAEVSGGGKKPWKQKGTGRARAGSTRGPIWRHGGVSFGPRSERNWELKINKKAKTKALFMSLSDKATTGHLIVVENFKIEPKTKEFVKIHAAFAKAVKDFGKNSLFLVPTKNEAVVRASRNVPNVNQALANSLNIVDVLKADTIIVTKDSLPIIEKTYLKEVVKTATAKKAVAKKQVA